MEGYLGKDRKLYAAFMDLEKAYDRVDREALWNVLRIYGVGGQLLNPSIQRRRRRRHEAPVGDPATLMSASFLSSLSLSLVPVDLFLY